MAKGITGTLAVTQGNQAISSSAKAIITGILNAISGSNAILSSGVVKISGILAKLQDDNLLSSQGMLGMASIMGSLAARQADHSISNKWTGAAMVVLRRDRFNEKFPLPEIPFN